MPKVKKQRGCEHKGCPREHRALGYCYAHYKQWKKYGKTFDLGQNWRRKVQPKLRCKKRKCKEKREVYAMELCRPCYNSDLAKRKKNARSKT